MVHTAKCAQTMDTNVDYLVYPSGRKVIKAFIANDFLFIVVNGQVITELSDASIGDSYLSCRCAQNGKACFASILLADVVSVSSRVVCYHDGLLVAAVLMYSVVCGKLTCLFLLLFLIVRLNAELKL